MKKRLCWFLLLLVSLSGAPTRGWGQGMADQGNPLKELRQALGGLNSGRIPTGVLLNRMLFITNPYRFAGQGDTAASYNGFEQQYWEYYHASLDTTQLLTLAALRTRVRQRISTGSVPLLMLSYRYNAFAATAARDRLITIDSVNERVTDGPDMSRSPYTSGKFLSVALPLPATAATIAVYVGPEFWLGNTPAPSSVAINFGDGQGVRQVAMGSTVQVAVQAAANQSSAQASATATGVGQPVRLTYQTSLASLTASTTLSYTPAASTPPDKALGLLARQGWPGYTPAPDVVSGPGGRATAIAWIKYAESNTARKLRHPLVFVEGIDFAAYRNAAGNSGLNHYIDHTGELPLSDFETGSAQLFGGYRNGAAGWNEMVDFNLEYKSLEKFPALRQQLQAPASRPFPDGTVGGDYDVIYLDFSDGAGLIQHNAMVLAELLRWINDPANRTPDADETLVIGASMGGQVARFGLTWMEQQGLCHNSKLYVSFDSPHRGANVPIGLQLIFDRLQSAWIGAGSAEEVVHTKLLRPATMQMVVFHFADMATPFRQQWQAWQFSANSYPSLLRKVAIANGSGQAAFPTNMSPGMLMLRTTINPFNGPFAPYVVGNNASYALGRPDRLVFSYRRPFSLIFRKTYSDPSWGNYDTAPGCSERTAGDAQDVSNHVLVSGGDFNTFMPTISTLDVQNVGSMNNPNFGYNVKQEITASDQPNRAKYAFDAYFAAGSVNEPHVQITNGQGTAHPNTYNTSYYTDNSHWIQNELRESAHRMPAALNGVYNYGSRYRHLLPSVQVNYGGRLLVNDATLPVSGGTPATQGQPVAGNFDLYTSNCPTAVRVTYNGVLRLGMAGNSPNTASLLMAANSLLDVQGGRVEVNPGSVLRIAAGATLVVRKYAYLAISGQVIVEAGAYVCIEDAASILTGPGGQLNLSPQAHFFANPALNLTGLACQGCLTPGYLVINGSQQQPPGQCATSSAVFTITDSQGTQGPYTWQVSNGTIDYGQGTTQISVSGLPFQRYTLQVHVSAPALCAGAADLTQDFAQDYYTRSPDGGFCTNDGEFMVLYPNPTTDAVEVHLNPTTATTAKATPVTARLFDAQGQPRAEQTSHGEAVLRLSTKQLPAGLYFVHLMRQGTVVGRKQLKIEH